MISQNKQSLFDVTVQNFGQMDELVKVSSDNNLSISEFLNSGLDLEIGNYEGNEKIKNTIQLQNITLNNNSNFIIERVIINKVHEDGSNAIFENGDNHILE